MQFCTLTTYRRNSYGPFTEQKDETMETLHRCLLYPDTCNAMAIRQYAWAIAGAVMLLFIGAAAWGAWRSQVPRRSSDTVRR